MKTHRSNSSLPTFHIARRLGLVGLLAFTAWVPSLFAVPTVERTAKVGQQLYEVVFNPADKTVYVASFGPFGMSEEEMNKARDHQIVGVDARTLKIKRTIKTGEIATFGLGINRKTQKLYVGDTMKGKIGVIDIKSGKVVTVISAPEGANKHLREIVADENTNKIYATVVGGFGGDDKPESTSALWVIDGKADKLEQVIVAPVQSATGLAVDPAAGRVYVSDMSKNEVAEIDTKTNKVLRTFSTRAKGKQEFGEKPDESAKPKSDTINIELDAAGGRLFAINQGSGAVTVVNVADGKLLKTIQTGAGALSAKFNQKTGELYVANRADGTVSVIDGKTYYITAHLPSGTHPQTIAIDPDTGNVYVSNRPKGKDWNATKEAPEPYEPGGDTITLIRP